MSKREIANLSGSDDGTGSDKDTDDEAEEMEMMYHEAHEASPQYSFPHDVYCLAFIMFMSGKPIKAIWPLMLCFACGVSQYVMTMASQRHVVDNVENRLWDPVSGSLWELAHLKKTMEGTEAICGTFQDYDIDGTAKIEAPANVGNKIIDKYFFYAKKPWWTWNTTAVGDDKSIMDTSRVILEEGFFGFTTGYSMIAQLSFFLWACFILHNVRQLMQCMMMILQVPGPKSGKPLGVRAVISEKDDGDVKFELKHMSVSMKAVGFFLVLWQLFMTLLVGYTGFCVLRVTVNKLDLILNSLALVFILELDDLVFMATTSKSQDSFLEDLQPIKYKSIFPEKYLRIHHLVMPVIGCVVCSMSAIMMRISQRTLFKQLFNAAAVACLFGGSRQGAPAKYPSLTGEDGEVGFTLAAGFYSPVPGFCESILKLSCLEPGTSGLLDETHGTCVIANYGFDFVKDVRATPTASIWPIDLFEPSSRTESVWDWKYKEHANHHWMFEHQQANECTDMLMRTCLAMYKDGKTEKRVTDGSTGAAAPAADFRCSNDPAIGLSKRLHEVDYEDAAPWLWRLMFGVGAHRPKLKFDIIGQNEELGKELARCQAAP